MAEIEDGEHDIALPSAVILRTYMQPSILSRILLTVSGGWAFISGEEPAKAPMENLVAEWKADDALLEFSAVKTSFFMNKKTGECFIVKLNKVVFSDFFTTAKLEIKSELLLQDPVTGANAKISLAGGRVTRFVFEGPVQFGTAYATVDGDGDGIADIIVEYADGKPLKMKKIPKFQEMADVPLSEMNQIKTK